MNCKPGDLAVVVGEERRPEYNGVFLTVVWACGPDSWVVSGHIIEQIARKLNTLPIVLDRYLRPIRDQPGEDETLTWAGKPADQTVTISSRGE